jgi:lipoprotein-anchoring transpeptidase ErfK/SrfK
MNFRARVSAAVAVCLSLGVPIAFATHTHTRPHSSRRARTRQPAVRYEDANDPSLQPVLSRGKSGAAVLRAQVLLDRAHFSVAEIDASFGSNTARAVVAFNEARGLPRGESISAETWKALDRDTDAVVQRYTLAAEDVAGPFEPIPDEMMEKANLPALPYSSPLEALGEKFHSSPELLRRMNSSARFQQAGEKLLVPATNRPELPRAASVRVSGEDHSVEALDAGGGVLARYPASVGSEHDPLPAGKWKINGVSRHPVFHYNPDLFWDADATDRKATLPAGPNNPVGVVWIDLSKPHYGLHGTAEPGTIGKGQTHGCIRMTNWDAWELSEAVSPGTPAVLEP